MFARRKARKQEDEPLVPHGLVWQATARPEAAPERNTPLPPQSGAPGKLVQMSAPSAKSIVEPKAAAPELFPLRKPLHNKTDPPASTHPDVPAEILSIPKKPVVASPPEFWRSLKKSELVKPAVPKVAPTPAPITEPIKREESNRAPASHQLRLRSAIALMRNRMAGVGGQFTEKREAAARAGVSAWQELQRFAYSVTDALAIAVTKLGEIYRSLGLMNKITRVGEWTVTNSRDVVGRARPYGRRFQASAITWCRAAARQTKAHAVRMRARANRQIAEIAHRRATRSSNSGLRIRLAGLPLRVRMFLARAGLQWSQWKVLRGDARLWKSVAMAGLSALLALGFIKTVQHYGTAALPSHFSAVQPVQQRNTPAIATPATAANAIPVTPPVVHASQTRRFSSTVTVPNKKVQPAALSRPKRRRSEDDDYVAKDTYVYYGKSSRSSR